MRNRFALFQTPGEMKVLAALLASLVFAFLLPPFLHYGELVLRSLLAAALAASAYLVRENRWALWVMAASGVAIVLSFTMPHAAQTRALLYFSGSAVFLVCVNSIFTARIFRAQIVDTSLLLVAICVYLGFAAFAAMLFGLLETMSPGSFHFPERPGQSAIESTFMYYSIVTISTLGYGDIYPLTDQARTIASFEAVAGQIYLTFVVARLVGLHVSDSSTKSNG